jgi:mono/diheme cytochrome c family protein
MFRLVVSAVVAVSCWIGVANAQSVLVERGDYLVNGLLSCGNCHTPKGPNGPIAEKAFSGGMPFDTPSFKVAAANITQDKATGIGSWTDAEIKKLMRTGENPNGVHVATVMPTGFYHAMTERDLDAVVAYLRTVKPIDNKVADPIYKKPQLEDVLPGAEKPVAEAALRDKVTKGFYLATIAHCMECHTPMERGQRQFSRRLGAGGFEFRGPFGTSVSRNITSSKTSGLGNWTDDEIKRAITEGISRDGSHLKPPMGYANYARVKPDDLDAIVAYLRTVPAIE